MRDKPSGLGYQVRLPVNATTTVVTETAEQQIKKSPHALVRSKSTITVSSVVWRVRKRLEISLPSTKLCWLLNIIAGLVLVHSRGVSNRGKLELVSVTPGIPLSVFLHRCPARRSGPSVFPQSSVNAFVVREGTNMHQTRRVKLSSVAIKWVDRSR